MPLLNNSEKVNNISNFLFSADYLKIAEEKSTIRGKYCGELTGKFSLADVNGHYAVVTFHSNGKLEKQGFVINFTAVSPCKYYQNGVLLKVIFQLTFLV